MSPEVAGLAPLEPVLLEEAGVLCFQQSAGNSASPEVDVAPAFLGDRALARDVGELEAASRSQDAEELGEDSVFVGDQVDHPVGDDDVEASVRERQPFCLPLDELQVPDGELARAHPCFGDHLGRHVDAGDASFPADHLGGGERVGALKCGFAGILRRHRYHSADRLRVVYL